MKIKDLAKPLSVENIEFRVDNIIKGRENKIFAQILAYKDARADMRVADEVLGPENWQCNFVRDSQTSMVCNIGVKVGEEWVWKAYNGSASNFESDKGTASDAFKRAWVMWGIGRHLYSFPSIFVELFEGEYYEKDGKIFASRSLRPQDWKWEVEYDAQGNPKTIAASHKGNNRYNFKQK
jgi:hypothetical protein